MRSNPQREYIRHTIDVPLEIRAEAESDAHWQQGRNVSFGGLAFITEACPELGQVLELRIPTVDPPFEARARVVWCRPEDGAYLVGVEFLDSNDAFQARMVQQVCSIERYRQEVEEREGRRLGTDEAAAEWIKRFAGRFPDAQIAACDDLVGSGAPGKEDDA